MKINTELKEAISQLTSKEKDKLIFRLLRHDTILTQKLYFELVSTDNQSDRREEVKCKIDKDLAYHEERRASDRSILSSVRFLSGDITNHLKVTQDKVGEVSLNLYLLNEIFRRGLSERFMVTRSATNKMGIYIVARAFKLLVLIHKLHGDLRLDFEDDLRELGKHIGKRHHMMEMSIYNGLDVNWLLSGEIPEDIEETHRELRSRGYLR